jgi:multidrug resistance efflux pump
MVGVAYEASRRDEHREVPTAKPPNQKGQASAPASKRVLNPLKGRAKIISILPDRTGVKKGQLICEFDPSELQDRLSDQAIQMTVAEGAYQNAQSRRELAELALREFKEGIYALELQGAVSEVGSATADLQIAQAEFDALKKDHKDSDLALMKAKRNLNRATFAAEKATSKKMILQKFTYERKIKLLNLDIEKARADELNNKAKFESEKRKRRAIEDEIERCKIHAPDDGVVILGPGVQVGLSASEQQLLFRFVPADQPTRSR